MNSVLSSWRALPPISAPRWGSWYGQTCSSKSSSGLRTGPASSMTTLSPPSVSTLAAVPPPAPDPMIQTSYTFPCGTNWGIGNFSAAHSNRIDCIPRARSRLRGSALVGPTEEDVVEGLGEGGVREDSVAQGRVFEAALHGDLYDGGDLAALDAEDGCAQDQLGVGVDDDLHEAACFVGFDGASDIGHRHFGHANSKTLVAGFGFGEADAAELRVDEDGAGQDAVADAAAFAVEEICRRYAVVVVRNVGEGGTALDVAESVDAGDIRFEIVVDLDEAVLVGCDSGGGEVERFGVRRASGGDKQMGAGDGAGFAAVFYGQLDGTGCAARGGGFGFEENFEAVFGQNLANFFGDVGVFVIE